MTDLPDRIAVVRRFNRFYTRRIGVLQATFHHSRFTLAEARIMYELAHREHPTAGELGQALNLDPGYLSRLLRGLVRRGMVSRRAPAEDRRRRHLRLTERGRRAFLALDAQADDDARSILTELTPDDQNRLAGAMATVEGLLGDPSSVPSAFVLRAPQPGDLGWVVERHGALYYTEYGWDQRFEGLVAGVVGDFVRTFDARRERCWIAELDGERVGSVFLVRDTDTVARLRLLLVEPRARGHGLGRRLVDECIRFARQAGYRKISLWTNSILVAAAGIYRAAGFRLVNEEPHNQFGPALVGQTWELDL